MTEKTSDKVTFGWDLMDKSQPCEDWEVFQVKCGKIFSWEDQI